MKRILFSSFLLLLTYITSAQTDTSFWFAAPDISSVFNYDRPIALKIAAYQQASTVTISQPANGGLPTQIFTIPANTLQSVDLTAWLSNIECAPGNTIQNNGIKITATNKISVYYEVNGNGPNPEMFALKGRNALGNQFYISSQYLLDNTSSYTILPYSSFNIVATDDNCVVTIIPTSNIVGHAANVSFQINLNKGQTYAAIATSQAATQHLQGSYVSSTKPIAVTLADDLLFAGVYTGVCADLAGDQTVPVNVTGSEYIAFRSNLNFPYDKVYITATQNATSIFQDGVLVNTLNAGQSVQLTVQNNSTYINTSAPVYAYQLSGIGCEVGSAILPKINCTGSSVVSVARSTNEPFIITLLAKNGAQNNFLINNKTGVITGAQFNVVPGTAGLYYFARISLPLSTYPNGSVITIKNTANVFQLGVLQGGVLSGGSFGYFSDFNSLQANAYSTNVVPCTGTTLSLFADTISSATYSWTGPNNFTSNLPNPSVNNISSINSGDYILKVTVPGCAVYNDTLRMKVIPKSFSTINQTICQGKTFNGYSITGTYIDTLAGMGGCDSIRTINLTVKPRSTIIINQTICQGQMFAGYSTTGTFVDTLASFIGCDSVRTINLTVKPVSASVTTLTICQGNSFAGYSSTGSYVDTLKSFNGCDSIRRINLTVLLKKLTVVNQSICTGQSFNGYSTPGTYIDTLKSANGCDSIRTINLVVNTNVSSVVNQTICQGQTYSGYTITGKYLDTLKSVYGCDSMRIINLFVLPASFSTIDKSLCQGENYAGYSVSGKYVDTLRNMNGCDSVRTINLVVKPSPATVINKAICKGESYAGYTLPGTYTNIFTAVNGCDSIQTIRLTVDDLPKPYLGPDVAICSLDTLLLSPGIFNTYLWQDGSVKNNFTVKTPGLYMVIVTNNCGVEKDEIMVTESNCTISFPTAFSPNNDQKNDLFKILNGTHITNFHFVIFNRWGEKVFETNDHKKGWDGRKNYQPADAGGYVWYCRYTDKNKINNLKGSVLLIR